MQTQTPTTLPNYHFLFISPELGVEWLFHAARSYFNRFRPTVITDFGFIRIIPQQYSFALTAVVRRDSAADWGVQLAQLRPFALFDPVVFETAEEARAALDRRAELSQPFGVPLANETPAAQEGDFLPQDLLETIPTPMVPIQGAEGWVTVTPPPTIPPTPTTAPTPLPQGDPIPPVEPTPGSLIDG
jgi:hypothetical protein